MTATESASAAPRILIVRLSAIGDVLHGLPVLCALRDALPKAHLAWLVEGRSAELLAGHPALDEVVAVRRRWLKSPRTTFNLWRRLRGRFDVTIDVQGLSKSAVAARLSGAPRRIGLAAPDGREISPWLNNVLVRPTATHVIDRNLELLGPLGIAPGRVRFDLPEREADGQRAEQTIAQAGATARCALLNPGAGWPSKLWPAERFAAVAAHLGNVQGLVSLAVWAGEQENAWARRIVARSAGWARLAPPTSLVELAALARRAQLMVSSDTGPLHLAAAVGTPCVGLFGPMPGERNGPYGRQHVTIQVAGLTGSSRQRRRAGNETMLVIDVARVTAACDTILAHRRDRSSA
ncbi:MAG TPA: glycosyltransferase family 9 protein [Pirellulales bacterium]|nr:glycosyltransferase family 9 protein [Pirellulales bacterium]